MADKDVKHEVNLLVKPGVANTEMVTREYQFTADNELDYTASIAATTTITVSELPSNTIRIYVYFHSVGAGVDAGIEVQRQSTDTQSFLIYDGFGGATSGNKYTLVEILTNGNQFYVKAIYAPVTEFKIIGYKVKE